MKCESCQVEIDKRTIRQNSSLHLYFKLLSEALNEAGLDMKAVIKPEVEISWTPTSVKEYLWKPLQEKLFGKRSTTRLKKKDIDIVYDNLNRILGERTEIFIPFPSIESMQEEYDTKTTT